jgi:hypothetical protein
MNPIQFGIDWKVLPVLNVKVAGAYYFFNKIQNIIYDPGDIASAGTNTRDGADLLVNDFDVVSVSGEIKISDVFPPYLPSIAGAAEYVHNPDPSDDNAGHLFGGKLGHSKVSGLGTWQVAYLYRRLEADAWLDTFPDSDFFGGGTNVKGHEVIVTFGLAKYVSIGFDYYHAEQINGGADQGLLQTEVVIKF